MNPDRNFRFYTAVCYALTAAVIVCLFAENFVFSSNLSVLGFRAIDDTAFQAVLRQVHLDIQAGKLGHLFAINDYGYGWIFWAPLVVLTYPLFLLSQTLSIDWPLIVVPREISLLLMVMSLVFMRKILKRQDVPEWGCASAVLILALFPTAGYFSLRFGTVNAVAFFSLLTLHLALADTPSTAKGRNRIAFSLAIAGGLKLSGLLIAPLILVIVLRRVKGLRLSDFIAPAAVFLVSLVVLTNPQFILVPFKPQIAATYWETLSYYLEVTRTPSGPTDPIERLYQAIFGSTIFALVVAVLAGGWLLLIKQQKSARTDMIAVLVWVLAVAAYLMFAVKNYLSVGSYFTGVSFLFLLGVIGYVRWPKAVYLFAGLIVLMFADVAGRAKEEFSGQLPPWNHLSYFIKEAQSKNDVDVASKAADCIRENSKEVTVGHIFTDYTAPLAINTLSAPNTCMSVAWNNLSPAGRYCDKPVDFLVLDIREAVGFLPKDKFEERIRTSDAKTAEGFRQDRQSREALTNAGTFGNQRFKLACDLGRLRIFKSENP